MPERAINFPKIGNLLISAPFIQDDDFTRAVVLICEIQTVGVVGLTLNKPTFFKLGDLIKDLEFLEKEVFFGGPVEQNSLHYIYMAELPIEGSISIGKNLWWGGDFEILLKEIKLGSLPLRSIRFFLGYSGWSSGQLEEECKENAWIICEETIDQDYFEFLSNDLWKNSLLQMGGEFTVLANYPIDPKLN